MLKSGMSWMNQDTLVTRVSELLLSRLPDMGDPVPPLLSPTSLLSQTFRTLARYRRQCTSWVMSRSGRAWRRLPSASCTPDTVRPARASPPGDRPGVQAPPRRRLRSEGLWPQPIAGRCGLHALQRRQWHLTPVLLPGESHGWRSLVGYSPWGQ